MPLCMPLPTVRSAGRKEFELTQRSVLRDYELQRWVPREHKMSSKSGVRAWRYFRPCAADVRRCLVPRPGTLIPIAGAHRACLHRRTPAGAEARGRGAARTKNPRLKHRLSLNPGILRARYA